MEYHVTDTKRMHIGIDLTRPLGQPGGVGSVYRTDDDNLVAKVCRLDQREEILASMKLQDIDSAVLKAAGVAVVVDTISPRILIMEVAPGKSLEQVIREWTCDVRNYPAMSTVVSVALGVARSVATLAATRGAMREWTHTDLKPDNIFISFDSKGVFEKVTLIDADSVLPQNAIRIGNRVCRPAPSAYGTSSYLRPSFLLGDTEFMDHDDMLFAFFVTVYRILYGGFYPTHTTDPASFGTPPDELVLELAYPVFTNPSFAPKFWPLADQIPASILDLLRRGLKNGIAVPDKSIPAEPIPTAQDFVDALELFHEQLSPQPVVVPPPVIVPRRDWFRILIDAITQGTNLSSATVFLVATLGYLVVTTDWSKYVLRPKTNPPLVTTPPPSQPAKHQLPDFSSRYK